MELVKEETEPKKRTLNDVAQEFNQSAFVSGRNKYKIKLLDRQIAELTKEIQDAQEKMEILDNEANELSKKLKDAPKEAVSAPEPVKQ